MRIWRLTALFWNIVERSRVQWKSDCEAFSKRFVVSEPTVLCFRSFLQAQSRQYGVFKAFCRFRAYSTVFSKRFVVTRFGAFGFQALKCYANRTINVMFVACYFIARRFCVWLPPAGRNPEKAICLRKHVPVAVGCCLRRVRILKKYVFLRKHVPVVVGCCLRQSES